jgi:hypothetical protein
VVTVWGGLIGAALTSAAWNGTPGMTATSITVRVPNVEVAAVKTAVSTSAGAVSWTRSTQ